MLAPRHNGPAARARLRDGMPGDILGAETIKETSGVRSLSLRDDRALRLEPSMVIHRRELLLALAASGLAVPAFAQSKEPVLIGVTGPLTGQYAQYGAQWKKGFDVALDDINGSGGVNGRPLAYV